MKGSSATQVAPERTARVEFKVRFTQRKGKGRRPTRIRAAEGIADSAGTSSETEARKVPEVDPAQIPKLTRLLVLGHHFERLVCDGVVRDYAEIARLTGLSRARVTQISNLTLLAPGIQERFLLAARKSPDGSLSHERGLRTLTSACDWGCQRFFSA